MTSTLWKMSVLFLPKIDDFYETNQSFRNYTSVHEFNREFSEGFENKTVFNV